MFACRGPSRPGRAARSANTSDWRHPTGLVAMDFRNASASASASHAASSPPRSHAQPDVGRQRGGHRLSRPIVAGEEHLGPGRTQPLGHLS